MAFITGYTVIRNHRIILNGQVFFLGEDMGLEQFLNDAYEKLSPEYPKFYKMDVLSRLGFIAGEVLLKNRSLLNQYTPQEVALVLANTHGSLDTDIRYFDSTKQLPSPSLFVYTLPNIVAGELCIRHGFKGENAFFISDRFDPAFMGQYVAQLLEDTAAKVCLAGWIDVLGDGYDVFLYLAEKQDAPGAAEHTEENITKLYQGEYGKVDGGS